MCIYFQSLQFLHSHDAQEKHSDAIWGIHWTPTDRVLSISADGTLKQYSSSSSSTSAETIYTRPTPSPHPVGIVALSVNEQGTKALYNSLEGRTVLLDVGSGDTIGVHESYAKGGGSGEQNEPAWSVSLHPTEETFAATGGTGNVTVHSASPSNFGEKLAKLESGRSKMGMCIKHSPDGTRIALSLETGQIYIFDLASSQLLQTYTAHATTVRALSWSSDSSLLLSASDDRRLTLFDVREKGKGGGGAVAALVGHGSWVLSTAFSPDGRLALSGSADKTIKVWDIGTRAAVSTMQDTGEVWTVSWRPHISSGSAGAFVSGGEDGVAKWWRSAGAS
ncbi:REC14 [Sanghuangporus vaninii]